MTTYTLEEVTDIIAESFASYTNKKLELIDVYNVEEIPGVPGSYTYDVSVYFKQDTEEDASIAFKNNVENDEETFKSELLVKIKDKIKARRPNLDDQDLSTIVLSVDTTSGRYTRSFNKGRARPNFDAIVPQITHTNVDVASTAFLELKQVVCTKEAGHMNVSFVINSNLSNKLYYRIKLSDPSLVHDDSTDFVDWLKSNAGTNGIQSTVQSLPPNLEINKLLSQAFDDTILTSSFDPVKEYRVHILAYFDHDQTFQVYFSQLL
jgi:hypothetical protein